MQSFRLMPFQLPEVPLRSRRPLRLRFYTLNPVNIDSEILEQS